MTTPTGHQDYQAYANWRAGVYSAGAIAVTSAAPVTVAEYVTNFASVFVRAQMTGGVGVRVTFNWYTNSTLATLVESYFWEITGGLTELAAIVPALANYLQVVVSTTNAGTQNLAFTLAPTNVGVPAIRYPATQFPSRGIAVNIGGLGALTATVPQMAEGPGQLAVNVAGHATQFNVAVQELDQSGAVVSTVFRQDSAGPAVNASFRSANRPLVIVVTNEDAAAHNFDYFVTVQGE